MNEFINTLLAPGEARSSRIVKALEMLLDRRSGPELPMPFDAARRVRDLGDLGQVCTYEDLSGAGCPMLLVHSVNAAACAKEMQPLFERFRGERPVVAVDLPGFGASKLSSRPERSTYQRALSELLVELHERFGKPVDVVASSLGAEFAAVAISRHQACVRSFWMLSPTGFARENQVERLGAERIAERRERLDNPLIGRSLFRLLRTRPVLRYFLSKSTAERPDPELERYMAKSAAQPGAHRAPLAFLAGALFEPNVRSRYYARIAVPTWIFYGDDPYTSFDDVLAFVGANSSASAERLPGAKGLIQFDATEHCIETMRRELSELDRFEARCEIANDVQTGWN
ncbi:MAG: alpha/beta hydrolase [Polyangiaceae bacterium]|nr:alpha/beta hydrolase [Myxococcales bacterium]MCB9586352.1 alpha/beta hydrolase [Polyangiaceae bacterium]MCB9607029.1 alpha/beta hydrolase [Polyangiaceae bacterium]